uniref:Uncharacterized protein n=1 Tax=Anguilla anguilla TaxID=7936 RepID=A0A0E9QF73_ANGAN
MLMYRREIIKTEGTHRCKGQICNTVQKW